MILNDIFKFQRFEMTQVLISYLCFRENNDNKLIYSVPYQHFTNVIEHYFSILKSRLQKLEGLTYNELKLNIGKVIKDIPKDTYKNLLIGSYKIDVVYVKKPTRKSSKKSKNIKNKFLIFIKIGVLNLQMCKKYNADNYPNNNITLINYVLERC